MVFPVDPSRYAAFLVVMFFMAISPGPANLFFIRTGLQGSRARVLVGVLGVNIGSLTWFIAAGLGLSALMIAFPAAFQVIAILGGVYLIWLGVKSYQGASHLENVDTGAISQPPTQIVNKSLIQTGFAGFMVQLLNPKALLFFSAVLPPFIDIHRPMTPQLVVFAATLMGMDMVSMTSYGFAAISLSKLLHNPKNKQKFDRVVGIIFVFMGLIIGYHSLKDLI